MTKLTNFSDEEIFAEARYRIKLNSTVNLLRELGQKIQEGKVNNTENKILSYSQDSYVYSLALKTGQLERRKK